MSDQFRPSFKNVLGEQLGFDGRSSTPTDKNIRALKEWLFDYETLTNEGAKVDFEAFWDYMHQKEAFWWKYFCGRDCRVEIREGYADVTPLQNSPSEAA